MLLIIFSDEVDGKTQVTKTPRSSDSVKIGLCIFREVEINDHVYREDINTSSKNVSAYQASCLSIFEVVINSKTKRLT